MALSKIETIKHLQQDEALYVVQSRVTKQPFVICDPESFNDQAWLFTDEESIKAFCMDKMNNEKHLLFAIRYENKDFIRLYTTLLSIGVNSVVYNSGEDRVEVDLSDFVKQQDFSQLEPAKRPLFNAPLQLSALYFWQNVRRPIKMEDRDEMEKREIKEQEEEMLINLLKSEVMAIVIPDKEDPKKFKVPLIPKKPVKKPGEETAEKDAAEKEAVPEEPKELLLLLFTDITEFQKYTRGNKVPAIRAPFVKAVEFLGDKGSAIVINPNGFEMVLTKDQITRILAAVKKK